MVHTKDLLAPFPDLRVGHVGPSNLLLYTEGLFYWTIFIENFTIIIIVN